MFPSQHQTKIHLLFHVTSAGISSDPALDMSTGFPLLPFPSCRRRSIKVGSVGGGEAHEVLLIHTYNHPAPRRSGSSKQQSTRDLGAHKGRCFRNSFPSNNSQIKRLEAGSPTPAQACLFMRTLSVDLVSSLQSSRGACLFKSIFSQVKFVALMNGRAESSIKGQRKITFICIQ